MQMRSEGRVVVVGLAAGIAIAVLPEGAVPLVAVAAALIAGALLPLRPMLAAVLVLVPTVVVAFARTVIDSDSNVGAVLVSLLSAMFVAAILTHLSAGVTMRRSQTDL